jgi:GNAT superfamily N-acetyltransferase
VARIYGEFGLEFDPDFEDDLLDVAASYAHGAFWVAEDADGLVGTCGVVPNGWARVIKRMYVAPRGRRSGLATALLDRCLAFGSYGRTELWSDVRFRGAHAMYRRHGFTPGPCRVLTDPDRSVERYFWR